MRVLLSIVVIGFAISMVSCNTSDTDGDLFDDLPEPFGITFTIDTVQVTYLDGENFYGNAVGINWYPDTVGILYSQSTSFLRAPVVPNYENNILTIETVKYYYDSVPPSYNEAFQLFSEGNYPYGGWSDVATDLGVDGIIITYTDADGLVWTTDKRAGEQESWSTFTISDHAAVTEQPFCAETQGTFDCRVFDGLGNSLDLRNGSFKARTVYKPE